MDAARLDHRALLGARPGLRRRDGQVHGAVPRPPGRAGAERDREHAVLRLRRDRRCVAYAGSSGVAFNLEHLFKITPAQAEIGKWILLIIGVHVALNFPFSVYGGVISGFQRYDINNMVAIVTSLAVAAVNVGGAPGRIRAVALVAATTCVRVVAYFVYRLQRLPGLPGPADPAVALPARPAARSHRLQRLLVDHRLGQQAELPARRAGHRRVPGPGAGCGLGAGRADHLRHAAPHQPVERRPVPGHRRQRRLAAERRGCSRSCSRAPGCRSRWSLPIAAAADRAGRSADSRVAG